jgi:hypothetical protein
VSNEKVDKEINFDVETAIKVCRQAGYSDHALSLARRCNEHDLYLKIQLEDGQGYREALDYISQLSFFEVTFFFSFWFFLFVRLRERGN